MKKALLLVTFLLCSAGCSPTWWQDFKSDPVKQTDLVLNSAASIEQVAIVVFGQLKPLLPADKQADFQSKFDGSIIALNKAMDAVRTAVKAAAEAQEPNPDLSKVTADVITAVEQVKAVIDDIRGLLKTPPVSASPAGGPAVSAPVLIQDPAGYSELGSMLDSMKAKK